jgi:4-alpha-glucanotransferase
MQNDRKSGVLLHVTSLPGRWGMGELGPAAREFAEFLAHTGQRLWQILPLGPIGYGWSPYSSVSAFAGNHLLISFDELISDGLLSEEELEGGCFSDLDNIDYSVVVPSREKILFEVAGRFEATSGFEQFCDDESEWLEDYALFMALREEAGGNPWNEWSDELRDREPDALKAARSEYAATVRRHKVLQYLFALHWERVRTFCNGIGVQIIGDIPIFVAGDSVDVWAHRELFFLNPDGSPTVVAGVPPDYFSETGQRWGNPLYDWAAHRAGAYAWWTARMRRLLELVDIVRIDHFRGFDTYWEIPSSEPTAINGRWIDGPGKEFFNTVEKNLRQLSEYGTEFCLADHVIAEDLGIITDDVVELRKACGFPGMIVLHFAFGADQMSEPGYQAEGVETNSVVYTGTHDNDTTQSWLKTIDAPERDRVREYLKCGEGELGRKLVELALHAPAKWSVFPLQDLLETGDRMNTPGTAEGNWSWRCSTEMFDSEKTGWLRAVTAQAGRIE